MILFTVQDVSKLLEVNPESVRRMARKGKLRTEEYNSRKQGMLFTWQDLIIFTETRLKYRIRLINNITINTINTIKDRA